MNTSPWIPDTLDILYEENGCFGPEQALRTDYAGPVSAGQP